MTLQAEEIAASLTSEQRALVLASDPDDITGRSGSGVPIRGAMYRTAKVLEWKHGLGTYSYGSSFEDLYFNNSLGLAVRTAILDQEKGK